MSSSQFIIQHDLYIQEAILILEKIRKNVPYLKRESTREVSCSYSPFHVDTLLILINKVNIFMMILFISTSRRGKAN